MPTKDIAHWHIVLVKGWVEKDGKFLLVKRSLEELEKPGVWSLPGGKVEDEVGNNIIQKTLKREIEEEVNIKIDDASEFVYSSSFIRRDGAAVVNLTFLCRYKSGQPKALTETLQLKWLSFEELRSFSNAQAFLKKEIKALVHHIQLKENTNHIRQLTRQIIEFGDERDWQQFYTPKDMSLALVAEVGELIEHFKWHTDRETEDYLKKHKQEISDELADVFFWILLMSYEFKIDLEKAFRAKMLKNERKYPVKQFRSKHSNPV